MHPRRSRSSAEGASDAAGQHITGRLRASRYSGLLGAALLAGGAYRVGALPGSGQASGVRTGALADAGYATAFGACALGLVLLAVAWWRLGVALREPFGAPRLRWILVTGALWAVPPLVAPPLGSRDVYAYACQGWLWSGGGDPYAGGVAGGGCPWLAAVPALWHDTPAPYGPLGILLPGAAVSVARWLPLAEHHQLVAAVGLLRLLALAGAGLVAWQGVRLARACGVREADAAWLGVVTPLAVLHVVSGAHHDAIVAGLLVAGLAVALHPRWPVAAAGAGALVGLAAAVKITAVVALPFVVLLVAGRAQRHPADRTPAEDTPDHMPAAGPSAAQRPVAQVPAAGRRLTARLPAAGPVAAQRLAALVRGTGVITAAAVAAFVAVTLLAGLGLGWAGALGGTSELKQWTSPPTGVGMAVGYLLRAAGWPAGYDAAIAVARVVGLVLLAGVLVALWLRAARAPGDAARAVACCGWALAAVVLLSPVAYPWYVITPVAVLAAAEPREGARRWLAVAVLVASFLVFPDGLGVAVLTKLPGAVVVAVLAPVAAWMAFRRSRRPGAAPEVSVPQTGANAPGGPGR